MKNCYCTPIVCGSSVFALPKFWYALLCPYEFCNHLDEEERTSCLALLFSLPEPKARR